MRDGKTYDTGEETGESYDLVVVGGGMSVLGAAYYFRRRTVPGAKILILDNHDDFGGHARRNEFNVDGRLLMARGGTSYIERPATFTVEGRELLTDIGVDYKEPTYKIEQGYYASLGLRSAQYFDRETFGVDKFVVNPAAGGGFGGGGRPPSPEFLAKTPLSGHVQK
jgi:spermidine dehydrogenase